MENHVHCAQGKHLNCYYVLWYLSKGALTLMPAQMDGYTNTCHGERTRGQISLLMLICRAPLKSLALSPFALLQDLASSLPSREQAAKAQVPNSCIYAVGAGQLTLKGSFTNPLLCYLPFFCFPFLLIFHLSVFSFFLWSQTHLVSLKTSQSSIMLIASDLALGFRRQNLPHLGLREALHSGALYCAEIWG